MPLKASVDKMAPNMSAHAYHASVHAQPGKGCGGKFTVRFEETCDPQKDLSVLRIASNALPIRSDVTIAGNQRTYQFPQMDVRRIRLRASALGRTRAVEARYNQSLIDNTPFPAISLSNESTDLLEASPLGDDYTFSLTDRTNKPLDGQQKTVSERLLWCESDVLFDGATVVRFISRRNRHNSWMIAMLNMLASIANTTQNTFAPFKVNFAPHPLDVCAENLSDFLVEEIYGHYLDAPLAPLDKVVSAVGAPSVDGPAESHSVASLLSTSRSDAYAQIGEGEAYEIATLVFKPGHYRDLALVR